MYSKIHLRVLFAILPLFYWSNLLAQKVLKPGFDFYLSKLLDTTSITLHEQILYPEEDGIWVLNPGLQNTLNTGYARGYNDGPVWKGKGLTSELHGGVMGKKGHFSFTFHPVIFYSQNISFPLAANLDRQNNPLNYQYLTPTGSGSIDWVQRYGTTSFADFNLGQSEARFEWDKFSTSIGTSNFTLGPAVFNPIIMSNQAAGIPRITFSLSPTDISIKTKPIITLETSLSYGYLKESEYFNDDESDNYRYYNVISVGLIPTAISPNLKIGFQKSMYNKFENFDLIDLTAPFGVPSSDELLSDSLINDTYDQMASISIEWAFPSVDFRAYAEFAKNDFTGQGRFFLLEPEHTRAYTIGFEKSVNFESKHVLNIIYEHTNLSRNHTFLWRAAPIYYAHNVNRQGYSINGQIIGAGIGPGSVNDQLQITLAKNRYKAGFSLQRLERNKDYFVVKVKQFYNHEVEFSQGAYLAYEFEKWLLSLYYVHSKNMNLEYISYNDLKNHHIALCIQYKLNRLINK